MITERSKNILKVVIREFIKTGEPVSSGLIYKNYDFGIKPAMIRQELFNLDKEGYLEQCYYSSGRIPTDKGYRFFVNEILFGIEKDKEDKKITINQSLLNLIEQMALDNFVKEFSKMFGLLSIMADISKEKFIYKDGLEYLIDDLDWDDKQEIKRIIRDFENIEENLQEFLGILNEENFLKIFIGKNPLIRSNTISVVVGDYKVKGEKILFLTVGSKRMNYEKTFKVFKGLKKYLYK